MNALQLAHKLSQALKKDIGSSTSQTGWHFQYGYSTLDVPAPAVRVLSSVDIYEIDYEPVEGISITVLYRIEGCEEQKQKMQIDLDQPNWWKTFLELATKVFEPGRTVECGAGIGLKKLQGTYPRSVSTCDYRLDRIHSFLCPPGEPPVDLDPDYQRGHVWTSKQASEFVGFLLQTGTGSAHAPLIFVQRYPSTQMKADEVIDGKQRLTAMSEWVSGEIPAVINGVEYWYNDTNEVERRGLPTFKLAFVDLPREQRLKFYLALNRGGTVHSAAEIAKVEELLEKETT